MTLSQGKKKANPELRQPDIQFNEEVESWVMVIFNKENYS